MVALLVIERTTPYVYSTGDDVMLTHPWRSLADAAFFYYTPHLGDILPLHVPLVAATPLLVLGLRRAPALTLTYSVVLWAVASLCKFLNLPSLDESGGWRLDPFSWQLLFVIGAAAGERYYHAAWPFRSGRRLRALCWVIVAGGLATSVLAHLGAIQALRAALLGAGAVHDFWVGIHAQNTEHAMRLCHFFAMAYLVASYVDQDWRGLRSWWSRPFVFCGQASLPTFCFGVILTMLVSAYFYRTGPSLAMQMLCNATGWTLMTLFAAAVASRRQRPVERDAPVGFGGAAEAPQT